jgi:hypothetical protein
MAIMKRISIFSLVCCLSGLLAIGCERGVRAEREGEPGDYQPRPAPIEKGALKGAAELMQGELMRVDRKNQTITVRAENGMEQTFKVSDETNFQQQPTKDRFAAVLIYDLEGKEGSEVVVAWVDEAGAKTATNIDVTQPVYRKNSKTKNQGRY